MATVRNSDNLAADTKAEGREGSVIVREEIWSGCRFRRERRLNEDEEIEGKFVTTKCGAMAAAKRDTDRRES